MGLLCLLHAHRPGLGGMDRLGAGGRRPPGPDPGVGFRPGQQLARGDACRDTRCRSHDRRAFRNLPGIGVWQRRVAGGDGHRPRRDKPEAAGRAGRYCQRPGLLAGIVGVDLFGISEAEARDRLRQMVVAAESGRAKPAVAPGFPGAARIVPSEPHFPGGSQASKTTGADAERGRYPEQPANTQDISLPPAKPGHLRQPGRLL